MAKQAKYEGVLDMLSELPDHILCRILWLLPIKDAVRTCILSTKWRYLFTSMSIIDFWHYCRIQGLTPSTMKDFTNLVDRLLYAPNHVGLSLERFALADFSSDQFRLYGWICATLCRGIKEIVIHSKKPLMLPTLMFTCQSLVTLKLDINADMKVPSDVCLPHLKKLDLKRFKFSDGSSFRLISSCPVLEHLVMVLVKLPGDIRVINIHNLSLNSLKLSFRRTMANFNRYLNREVVINAPNLECFEYIIQINESHCLSTMNSLVRATIVLGPFNEGEAYYLDRQCCVANLLQAICNVKSLHLMITEAETLLLMPREPVLPFDKLVKLEICNTGEDWQGTWVVEFLHFVPNLKTLLLSLVAAKRGIKPLPKEVPFCLLFHLEEIKILQFQGDEPMFEMISYFLYHAGRLEKLIIPSMKCMKPEEQLKIIQKLLMLPRNSKKCQVMTR